MITIDRANRQITSILCFNCKDECFQPPTENIPKVGCCSYSPTLYLLQIANMCKRSDIIDVHSIIGHPAAVLKKYSVRIQAEVHSSFKLRSQESLTQLEIDDLRQSYAICQFFKENKGCSLDPSFKNAVCRSFICSSIEESSHYDKQAVQQMTRQFRMEEYEFQEYHESILEQKGINLRTAPNEVIQYFQTI